MKPGYTSAYLSVIKLAFSYIVICRHYTINTNSSLDSQSTSPVFLFSIPEYIGYRTPDWIEIRIKTRQWKWVHLNHFVSNLVCSTSHLLSISCCTVCWDQRNLTIGLCALRSLWWNILCTVWLVNPSPPPFFQNIMSYAFWVYITKYCFVGKQ